MKSLQDVYVNRANAILMIVDMQNNGCKPGGKTYDQNEIRARIIPGAVTAIQRLVEEARSINIPIIYIQSVRTGEEPEVTVFGHEPYLKVGTWGVEITDDLKPHPGDTVIQKFCHDPFYKTDLDQVLQRFVPDPTRCYAIVAGGAINFCLYHGVMGFHLRNYWTVVVTDGVYYGSEAARTWALEQFSAKGYPNVFLSRSDLIHMLPDTKVGGPAPVPEK